jgi:hypothetical protein
MKKIFVLLISVLLFVGCRDGDRTADLVGGIEDDLSGMDGGLHGACSLSRNTSLQNVLRINNGLSSMVAGADAACQNSVSSLNGDMSRNTIQTLAGNDIAATDYAQLARELEVEIEYLTANNTNGVYDQQIQTLTQRRSNALMMMRSNLTQFDNAQIAARRDALRNLGSLYTNYQNVFEACDNADPRAISAIANSGLNLASSLGAFSGGSAMAASLMMQVISAVGNSIVTMNERIRDNLQSARLPTILTCATEAVSKAYCEAKKQYEMISFREAQARYNGTCSMHEGVESLVAVSDHIEDLRDIFTGVSNSSGFPRAVDPNGDPDAAGGDFGVTPVVQSGKGGENPVPAAAPTEEGVTPSGFTWDVRAGQTMALGNNELQRRFLELTDADNMNAIRAYASSLEGYADAEDGDTARITYLRDQLATATEQLDQAISNIDNQLAGGEDTGTLAEFFTNPTNNIEERIEAVAILQENIIREQINAQESGENPTRSADNADYNLSVLAGASARIAGADFISDAINLNADVAADIESRSTVAALENAIDLGAQNMDSLSNFVTGNDINIGVVIDQVRARNADAAEGETRREAAEGIVQTLCGSSLTLYKSSPIPSDLREKCRDFNLVPGQSYEELANLSWDQRVCIPIEAGIIGDALEE